MRPGALFAASALVLAIAAGAGAEGTATVQNPDRTFTPGADHDTIVERGWISFGVYEDFAPYSWEEGGELRGTDIELGRLIAEELGVEARFRALAAGESVDDDLRHHVWKGAIIGREVVNVMLHVPWDRELDIRNELVVLTGSYMVEEIGIAYSTAVYEDAAPVPAFFRFETVGVENDSLADFYLSGLAGGTLMGNIRRFRDTPAAMAALRAGEVTAVMGPVSQLTHGADEGVAVHTPPLVGLSRGRWQLGVAIRHNYRALAYAVDDAVAAVLADGRLAAAFERFGLALIPPER